MLMNNQHNGYGKYNYGDGNVYEVAFKKYNKHEFYWFVWIFI